MDIEEIGATADLAIFDVGLLRAGTPVDKGTVLLATIGAAVGCGVLHEVSLESV